MKRILRGFAFILFGIAMLLAYFVDPWIPILGIDCFSYIGIVSSIIGLAIVVKESKE